MKVLLIKIDGIGDNILLLPFVHFLLSKNFNVYIITNKNSIDIYNGINVKLFGYIRNEFQQNKHNILSNIKKLSPFDILINPTYSPSDDSVYLSKMIDADSKYAFAK